MAKAYLIRKGYQEEFDRINLYARELGFALDTSRLLIGDGEENIHIPNEQFVASMITAKVLAYKPKSGTTVELDSAHVPGTFAYDTEMKRVIYKSASGAKSILARTSELPMSDATAITVATVNIDIAAQNGVLLTSFNRPLRMIFLNGKLCTNLASDPHQYIFNETEKTVLITECVAGDIISYF